MKNMKVFMEGDNMKKCTLIAFIGGVLVTAIAPKIAKSDKTKNVARKVAVGAVATGMKIQKQALSGIEEIKEDAQDIVSEAKNGK